MAIITSLLDCDLYKFKMLYFYWKMGMTDIRVSYKLTDRGNMNLKIIDPKEYYFEMQHLEHLRLSYNDLEILKKYFPDMDFINWISQQPFGWEWGHDAGEGLIYNGTLGNIILYETPIMAIRNELFSKQILVGMGRYAKEHENMFLSRTILKYQHIANHNKIKECKDCLIKFIEFGTRRRSSLKFQRIAIEKALEIVPEALIGTSNIMLAHEFGLEAKGTVAHEVPMLYAAQAQITWLKNVVAEKSSITHDMYRELYSLLQSSQKKFIGDWNKIYPETYYLTDTYGTEWFLRNCPADLASFRQDSGNPDLFMDRVITTYPDTKKNIMFSDGLDIEEILRLRLKYTNQNISFGWGTNLTNDGLIEPLRIVIKLYKVEDGFHSAQAVKLSDNPKKAIGQPDDISTYKVAFSYPTSEDKDVVY